MSKEPLLIVVSREEVEALDTSEALNSLNKLLESPFYARHYKEYVDISFSGYDDWQEEVYEIMEVRNYVYKLDEQFHYWLYFLSKEMSGLYALAMCFIPPFLKDDIKEKYVKEGLADLLTNRWIPAMNRIGEFVEMGEDENNEMTEKSVLYFIQDKAIN